MRRCRPTDSVPIGMNAICLYPPAVQSLRKTAEGILVERLFASPVALLPNTETELEVRVFASVQKYMGQNYPVTFIWRVPGVLTSPVGAEVSLKRIVDILQNVPQKARCLLLEYPVVIDGKAQLCAKAGYFDEGSWTYSNAGVCPCKEIPFQSPDYPPMTLPPCTGVSEEGVLSVVAPSGAVACANVSCTDDVNDILEILSMPPQELGSSGRPAAPPPPAPLPNALGAGAPPPVQALPAAAPPGMVPGALPPPSAVGMPPAGAAPAASPVAAAPLPAAGAAPLPPVPDASTGAAPVMPTIPGASVQNPAVAPSSGDAGAADETGNAAKSAKNAEAATGGKNKRRSKEVILAEKVGKAQALLEKEGWSLKTPAEVMADMASSDKETELTSLQHAEIAMSHLTKAVAGLTQDTAADSPRSGDALMAELAALGPVEQLQRIEAFKTQTQATEPPSEG